MNWILVTLQTVAMYSNHAAANWQPIGEFRDEKACIEASAKLVQTQQKAVTHYLPSHFVCLKKDKL
jgi:hypothetical protein